ncbi:MAG: metallophosphoesterase [Desulfocapsa sp.]|nr:metallophosphoesterase [Desulfocapsa sp.]
MSVFLFVYIAIYSAMNGYCYCRLLPLLPENRAVRLVVSFLLMTMVPAPILIRVLERSGWESGLTVAGLLAFSWMGFLFIFVVFSLTLDSLRLLLWVGKRFVGQGTSWPRVSSQIASLVSLILAGGFFAYGLFEAQDIRQEHVVLSTAKLPPGVDRLRIVQVSDVHLGLLVGERTLGRIVKAVSEAEPDLLVSTGDLVDSSPRSLVREAEMWSGVNPRLGKLAVTGNHEFYTGIEDSIYFTSQAGFVPLRDEVQWAGPISVVGLDDHRSFSVNGQPGMQKKVRLSEDDRQRFVLLLKHRPGRNSLYSERADLQLSGHTHQGQIFPFGLVTRMIFPFPGGLSSDKGEWLYVSRGSATWGPPIRVFSPPEITIIDLVSDHAAKDQYTVDVSSENIEQSRDEHL